MTKLKDFLKGKGPRLLKAGLQTVIPGGSLLASLEDEKTTPAGELNKKQLVQGLVKDGIKLALWLLVITGKLSWDEAEKASEFILGE